MINKKRILVIFGGMSNEYEVSLQSAYAVITNFNREKYEILTIGITRSGRWFHFHGAPELLLRDEWYGEETCTPAILSPDRGHHGILKYSGAQCICIPVDLIFPVLHGKNGEDGTIQGLAELAGIPLIGCGIFASAAGMDKAAAHTLAQAAGLRVPPSAVLNHPVSLPELKQRTAGLKYPLFVKPARAGSSFGITKAANEEMLARAVQYAFETDSKVVIEEAVPGFEVGCAVIGNEYLLLGAVDEIELAGDFFDYQEKYSRASSKIHLPARIPSDTARRIQQAAATVYEALGCRGFARADFFLTPENEIIFNEINTIPGLTASSRYPSMLAKIGIPFSEMLDRLAALAQEE